ncbi:MAG: AzlC family ABC transporter permease [Acidimicrobiia bacterium]|nr:AzlC family ABC transporter permease [Acidimicrobiia bacterium]
MSIVLDHRAPAGEAVPKAGIGASAVAGVRAIAPLVAGLVPFGLAVGSTAGRADLPSVLGWASSVLLYGGSGQLALVEVLGGGGPAVAAVVATMAVNLQMLLYGAGMRTHWVDQPSRWQAAAAYLLVGPVFAVSSEHHRSEPDPARRRAFYVAAGLTLWSAWLVLTGVGYVAGGVLPSAAVLALLTPLVLLTMAVRAVRDRAGVVALVAGATVSVLCSGAPHDLGFVAGGVVGVVAGVVADRRSSGMVDR